MGDLIDRDKLMEALGVAKECSDCQFISRIFFCKKSQDFVNACEQISEAPAVEQKKGRWIFTRYYVWKCSECGKNPTMGMGYTQRKSELFRYCPNCGASMEVRE